MRSIIASIRRLTGQPLSRRFNRRFRMNRYERTPQPAGEAEIEYLDGEYRVRKPGAYVRCAITGEPIPLEDLRYWNVDLQEPYAGPHAKLMKLGLKKPD
jgi:hypothetical protein